MDFTADDLRAYLKEGMASGAITEDAAYDAINRFQAKQSQTPTQSLAAPDLGIAQDPAVQEQAPQEQGLISKGVEMFTGSQRRTPETEAAKTWEEMPEFSKFFSMPTIKAAIGTMFTGAEEEAQVIAVNAGIDLQDPNQARKDEKGNWFFRSPSSGEWFVQKPGFRATDIPGVVGAGVLGAVTAPLVAPIAGAMGGGTLATMGTVAGLEALTQAGIEGTQAATGGTFDPKDIALAGATGGALTGLGEVAKRGLAGGRAMMAGGVDEVIPTPSVAQVAPEAPMVASAQEVAKEAPIPKSEQAQIGDLLRKAQKGSKRAQQKLAEQGQFNKEAMAQADELGFDLPSDVFADNQQVRSAAGLARSEAGSSAEASFNKDVSNAINRADELLEQHDAIYIEGMPSTGRASDKLVEELQGQQSALKTEYQPLYDVVDEVIDNGSLATVKNIDDHITNVFGNVDEALLSPQEAMLLKFVDKKGKPTYQDIKRIKNQVGKSLRGGIADPYPNLDKRELSQLYDAVSADQLDTVAQYSEEAATKLRQANLLYAKKKGIDKALVDTFGTDELGSLGKKMTSMVNAAADGDHSGLMRMVKFMDDAEMPEQYKKEVLMTALAKASNTSRGQAQRQFGFSDYVKVYKGLRSNPKAYSVYAKALGKDGEKVLQGLYEVSRRVTDARARVLQTGKANQVMLDRIQLDNFMGRILNSGMGRMATTGAAAASGAGFLSGLAPSLTGLVSTGGKTQE
jgi:hypothetical protein